MSQRFSPIASIAELARWAKLLISLLVGEMAGRPEGGAVLRTVMIDMDEKSRQSIITKIIPFLVRRLDD